MQISDTGTFGGSLFLPGTQDMYRYQVSESAVHVRGRHELRFGADYNAFNMRNNTFALGLNGGYVFPTLEAFIARQPLLYVQNFGLNGYTAQEAALLDSFWQHEAAAYVQDRIRPTARLTLALGLRFDLQINPQPQAGIAGVQVPVGLPRIAGTRSELTYAPVPQGIPQDRNNWGPRGEVAYQWPDEQTLVKGSAGLYYGRTPMIYFPLRGAGVSNTTLFVPASRAGALFPRCCRRRSRLTEPVGAGGAAGDLLRGSRFRESAGAPAHRVSDAARGRHVARGRLHTQRVATPSRWWISRDGVGSESRGADPVRSVWPWHRHSRRRPARPTIAQANALASFGHGRYQAVTISLSKPLTNHWQFYANYTLAKSLGNGATERDTEAVFGPSDPFNIEADYGINELDERHQIKSYLVATLPRDVTLSSTWSAGSGLAFPVYSSVDLNGDGVVNDGLHPDRPVVDGQLLPRFPYHQPAWATWDVRAAKGVMLQTKARVQLFLDVFNLLNAGNTYADPRTQAILGSPNFQVKNQTLGPRLAQLGIRVDF